MRELAIKITKTCTAAVMAVLTFACSTHYGSGSGSLPEAPLFRTTATIQDLMDSKIDPAADFIWGSVGTIITAAGVEDRQPRTSEQWTELRRKAIILVDASNFLVVPGRRAASNEFPSAGLGVLSSTDIEHKIANDRVNFDKFVSAFRTVAVRQLQAIDRRDVAALSDAGEALDGACEACHIAYWYPHQIIPQLPDF